jgi:hypothetical protein
MSGRERNMLRGKDSGCCQSSHERDRCTEAETRAEVAQLSPDGAPISVSASDQAS